MPNQVAPEGQVWVCGACGKRSRDMYGMQPISQGWDESCMLHSILCYEDKLVMDGSRVIKVEDGGVVKTQRDVPVKVDDGSTVEAQLALARLALSKRKE